MLLAGREGRNGILVADEETIKCAKQKIYNNNEQKKKNSFILVFYDLNILLYYIFWCSVFCTLSLRFMTQTTSEYIFPNFTLN